MAQILTGITNDHHIFVVQYLTDIIRSENFHLGKLCNIGRNCQKFSGLIHSQLGWKFVQYQ